MARTINLKIATTFLVLSLAVLTPVTSQQSIALMGGSPAMNYSRELLKRRDVQEELRLTASQKAVLRDLLSQERIVARAIKNMPPVKIVDISKLSYEERKQWEAKMARQAAAQAIRSMEEQRREVDEVLSPDQRQRLSEIDLQWRGILAVVDKSVSNNLGVSAARYKRIAEIVADFEVRRIGLLDYPENTNSARYEKRRILLQETERKVFALLTEEEKMRWERALGMPFSFEK